MYFSYLKRVGVLPQFSMLDFLVFATISETASFFINISDLQKLSANYPVGELT